MRKRHAFSRTLLLTARAAAAAASVAAAMPLGEIANAKISAAAPTVGRCDTHGFTAAYTLSGDAISMVTVGAITDPGCEGATLDVTITDANGAAIATAGPQTIPDYADSDDNAVTLALDAMPATAAAIGVEISVTNS